MCEKVIRVEQETGFPRSYLHELIIFFLIHYIFWLPLLLFLLFFVSSILASIPFVVYCSEKLFYCSPPLSTSSTFYFSLISTLISLFYLPSFLDSAHHNCKRSWPWFRQQKFWLITLKHIGVEIIRTTELSSKKNYIFAYHPHGILVLSRVLTHAGLWEELFPGIDFRVLGASAMFYVPFCRDICLWMGVIDASRETAERALANKMSLIIYPGGSKEIFETDPNSNVITLVLKERKGFIKLALRQGVDLVPVVVFGEKEMYSTLHIPERTWKWFLKKLRLPLLVFWGKYYTWIPREKPLCVIFGAPIPVEKVENPTPEQVDKLHALYIEKLKELFQTQKKRYPWAKNLELKII